jgi:RNase H-fold protein (predicted Holliday junction resolvase)
MRDTGIRADRRKTVIDQIAAEIILQEYLESRRKPDS